MLSNPLKRAYIDPSSFRSFYDNYFLQAQKTRESIRAEFDRVFAAPNLRQVDACGTEGGVDMLLHPAAISTAPTLEAVRGATDSGELSEYVQDILTTPSSLAGLPSLCFPFGRGADGMPIGATLTAQWGCDRMLWPIAKALQV